MNEKRRPSFQFYPQDWTGDTNLQSCSLESQGFWIKFLCKLHDSKVYGKFCFSKIQAKDIANDIANIKQDSEICSMVARVVGVSKDEAVRCLNELINASVIKINPDGYLFSSRMVRDERLRKVRQESGSQGGKRMWKGKNDINDNGSGNLFANDFALAKPLAKVKQTVEEEDEEEKEEEVEEVNVVKGGVGDFSVAETFEKFWKIYDKNVGRVSCEHLWIALTDDERYIAIDHAIKYIASNPDKKFRANPENYLEKKMWNDEIIESKPLKNGNSKNPTPEQLSEAHRKRFGG